MGQTRDDQIEHLANLATILPKEGPIHYCLCLDRRIYDRAVHIQAVEELFLSMCKQAQNTYNENAQRASRMNAGRDVSTPTVDADDIKDHISKIMESRQDDYYDPLVHKDTALAAGIIMLAIILVLGFIFWIYKHNQALKDASALRATRTLNRQAQDAATSAANAMMPLPAPVPPHMLWHAAQTHQAAQSTPLPRDLPAPPVPAN